MLLWAFQLLLVQYSLLLLYFSHSDESHMVTVKHSRLHLHAFMVQLFIFRVNLSLFWPWTMHCHFNSAWAAQQNSSNKTKVCSV